MKKIIVDDDNEQNLYSLQTLLKEHGYKVIAVQDDLKAQELAQANLPEQMRSEERFRALIENNYDLVQTITSSGQILYANRTWLEVMGYKPEELAGLNLDEITHPDARQAFRRELRKVMVGKRGNQRFQTVMVTKMGRLVELEGNLSLREERDQVPVIDAFLRNITEQRLNERIERLRSIVARILAAAPQAEDALRQVMQAVASQFNWRVAEKWWVDEQAGCARWQDSWHYPSKQLEAFEVNSRSLVFQPGEGMVGRVWEISHACWVSSDTDPNWSKPKSLAAQAGLHTGMGVPILTGKQVLGVLMFFGTELRPVHDQMLEALTDLGGQIGQYLVRRQTEQLLVETEQRYRWLFEETPAMYVLTRNVDDIPVISDVNQLFLDTLGYCRADVIGIPLTRFLSPTSQQRMQEVDYQTDKTGRSKPDERKLVGRDGQIIQTLLYAYPEMDRSGKVIGMRAMYVDITNLKAVERLLVDERALLARRVEERTRDLSFLNAELLRANRSKDEFLANMSHELRTPLNGILALSESLIEQVYGELNERQQKSLRIILSSGQQLLELITDILDLSKIEAGRMDIQLENCSVERICEISLMFVKELAMKKKVALAFQCTPPQIEIYADERRLKQILVNLLNNAVKFTPAGGRVNLLARLDTTEGVVQFSVEDTGIGISSEDLTHLFMPFVQVDSSLTRYYEGTGLGLALVRLLAELHGGGVSVRSEVGKGSCFTITLPLHTLSSLAAVSTTEMGDHQPTTESVLQAEEAGKRILLVEDNETNIAALGQYLEAVGYQVVIARNGYEALDRANENPPDLILMDIQMPMMDGLEATRRLRANPRLASIPIIALTALVMSGDRERCLQAGANEYLSKPVSLKMLGKKIAEMLNEAR